MEAYSLAGPSNSATAAKITPEQQEVTAGIYPNGTNPKLRYQKPYWWPYRTFVKQRWIGRELLEVISTEFRDRSVDYYRHALESGVTRVNGVEAYPELVLHDGDRIDNTVHRHEPPVTNNPILVLHIDREKEFIVISKPGSVPVHATGRYFRHTILEILKSDHGIDAYAVNRLDRLTSGLMIMALSGPASSKLAKEFENGTVEKEYVARVNGEFPEEEIEVDKPLLTVDRQIGLVIVTPEGKEAKTIFKRLSYDPKRDQSVVHCRPKTGRTHQLRVHLQYLGHPISNDPLYSMPAVWGETIGKGGVELVTSSSAAPSQAESIAARVVAPSPADSRVSTPALGADTPIKSFLGENRDLDNIDVSSPIRLSQQAKTVISKLRRMKDEAEDWVKWKEVVFKAKEAQDALEDTAEASTSTTDASTVSPTPIVPATSPTASSSRDRRQVPHPREVQREQNLLGKQHLPDPLPDDTVSPLRPPAHIPEGFCNQCFVPLPDDPDPESLFIYLHALRYTTVGLGTWETPMPRWAAEEWDGEWRGWVDGAEVPTVS